MSNTQKIRYGIIGLKGMGQYHLRFAQQNPNAEVTALVDVDEAFVNAKGTELGVPAFTDFRQMLDADLVDAVSIATPHHLLGTIGLACLQAGVHIFVEKPFAIRISEVDAMLAAAQARNLKICVGYQYRTYRTPKLMKQIIDSGRLGNLSRLLWTWLEFRPESYYERAAWRSTWQGAGGGVLMNQVSHDLDLIGWLMGQPVQVSALMGNQLHQAPIEDIVCVNMQFASGAFGSFQATINQPRGYSVRQIAGDKGVMLLQDVQSLTNDAYDEIMLGSYEESLANLNISLSGHHDQPPTTWQSQLSTSRIGLLKKRVANSPFSQALTPLRQFRRRFKRAVPPQAQSGHGLLMSDFIDSILNDREPLVSGASVARTVEMINAIILSAMRQKTITFPVDRQEYDELFAELCEGATQVSRFRPEQSF